MEFFGIEVSGEHARLILTAVGSLIAGGGFLAGRWSKHRGHVNFKREDLVTSSIVIEMYGVQPDAEGGDTLHIIAQGSPSTLADFFLEPELVARIRHAATRHPGLIKLQSPLAHRMMMDEGKDMITGLDPRANMDFVHGRATQDDETLFGFAAYPEQSHDGTKLHDQVGRLVLMVVSPSLIDRLADADYIARLKVRHSGYRPRCARLQEFALEWRRLQALPPAERNSGTDKIWQITVRTSRT